MAWIKQTNFTTDIVFLPKPSAMQPGYIINFVSAFVMLRIFWQSAKLLLPTILSVVGVKNSGQRMLEHLRNLEAHLQTHGTWMRYTSWWFEASRYRWWDVDQESLPHERALICRGWSTSQNPVVCNLFNLGRHFISANHYRLFRMRVFASWLIAVA